MIYINLNIIQVLYLFLYYKAWVYFLKQGHDEIPNLVSTISIFLNQTIISQLNHIYMRHIISKNAFRTIWKMS